MEFKRPRNERRSKFRFAIERDLRYKIAEDGVVVASGSGQTINIGSGGIAFGTDQPLAPSVYVELSISWPVLLDQTCPMRLVVFGQVLRCTGRKSVCSIDTVRVPHAGAHVPAVGNYPPRQHAAALGGSACAKKPCGPPWQAPEVHVRQSIVLERGNRRRLALGLGFGLLSDLALRFALRLDFALALALRSAVGIGFGLRFPIGACGRRLAVAAVIGHVPTRSLELNRRQRNQPFQLSAASFVDRQDRIREFLPDLKSLTTLVTPIIVKWHGLSC